MRLACAAVLMMTGCPDQSDEAVVRVGADRSLEEHRLIDFALAAFERETKIRTRLIYDDTDRIEARAESGELDAVFVASEESIAKLEREGTAIRIDTFAREEFVVIGPRENVLGTHLEEGDAVLLIKNISRSNYRFFEGKRGSLELDRLQWLFRKTGDRELPGSYRPTDAEGIELVERAIESRALALVKRSSLIRAAEEGHSPERIYRERDPMLVLRIAVGEVHPAKTRARRKPELYDFLMSERGRAVARSFGSDHLGGGLFFESTVDSR